MTLRTFLRDDQMFCGVKCVVCGKMHEKNSAEVIYISGNVHLGSGAEIGGAPLLPDSKEMISARDIETVAICSAIFCVTKFFLGRVPEGYE